jgi:hypothetical protein
LAFALDIPKWGDFAFAELAIALSKASFEAGLREQFTINVLVMQPPLYQPNRALDFRLDCSSLF